MFEFGLSLTYFFYAKRKKESQKKNKKSSVTVTLPIRVLGRVLRKIYLHTRAKLYINGLGYGSISSSLVVDT